MKAGQWILAVVVSLLAVMIVATICALYLRDPKIEIPALLAYAGAHILEVLFGAIKAAAASLFPKPSEEKTP